MGQGGRDNMRCILKRDEERDLKERQKRGRGEAGAVQVVGQTCSLRV